MQNKMPRYVVNEKYAGTEVTKYRIVTIWVAIFIKILKTVYKL